MIFDPTLFPSQAVFPLGIALAYIVLILYTFSWRRPEGAIDRWFLAYLILTALWDFSLVVAVNDFAVLFPGFTWVRIASYGLIVLGLTYWSFSKAFLYKPWQSIWSWLFGAAGLALAISFDLNLINLPPDVLSWSNGWLTPDNLGFVLSVTWWGIFMLLALGQVMAERYRTENPAHRNRIHYLLISDLLFVSGYGLYLSLREPFWTAGLIITGLAGVLTTYIVIVEDLLDLGTGLRRIVREMVVVLAIVSVYVVGVYLVQVFLGEFLLTNFAAAIDQTLLITGVTVIFLAIFYMPIRRMSQNVVDRFLFAQGYDYSRVIQSYSQVINNRLYLIELVRAATAHIEQAMRIRRSTVFMVEARSATQIILNSIPTDETIITPETLTLQKSSPISQQLIQEKRALAQYTVDISNRFKQAPQEERQTLKNLKYEWFVPIHKEGHLIGLLAVGTKESGRPYTTRDINLLTTLADQTALALENATLFDRVQRNLQEITRMKNLMDSVFDSMDNGVITIDVSGKITFFNRAAELILARRLDQMVSESYTRVLPELASTIVSNLVQNVIQRQDHYNNYEIVTNLPDRGRVNLNLSLTSLKDAYNETRGVTMVMDDLTQTKRLEAVQDMFRRYVSPAVVDRLPEDPQDLELGGHRQETTILFADIRGFTSFSEHLAPEDLVEVLNQYLSMAAASILMFEGTLDKFMGDAVMGIFNAPLAQEDHVLRAVRAAAAMQRAIADYHNAIGETRTLQFGVGLHVGEVVVGNVGMSDRMDYTAIGDAVNLAKRIQENTPGGKILLSEDVYAETSEKVDAIFYQELSVKGRQQPVKVYELRGV